MFQYEIQDITVLLNLLLSQAVFIDVKKHKQLLRDLIICMNSVAVGENEDDFQRKTDAITELLSLKGITISEIISVEQSTIAHMDSLPRIGACSVFEVESFLFSTLDQSIIPTVSDGNNDILEISIVGELSSVGIMLYAVYQQRCNNPPDARFVVSPEPQRLSLEVIPFSTTFLSDDDSTSVVFTVVQEKRKRLDGIPAADDNNVVDLIDDDDASSEKSTQPQKKSRGRPSKTTTNAGCK